MVPFGLFAVEVNRVARASSKVRPIAASRAGSICTRTARLRSPPMKICDTPEMVESCWARMLSAQSLVSMIGNSSDCTEMMMIGLSDGLTFQKVGGVGRLRGNWPVAAVILACTSSAAASMLRSRSNWMVIEVAPSTEFEVICATPGICANWRSSGWATAVAMVSGLAPGKRALTLMVGNSTRGSGATGSSG